jgi:DNA-binding NarL/FixJ family response regulator
MAQLDPIRILSVEDHPVFSKGLATIIETESDTVLVGQAANGVEAIAEFRRRGPDIRLMDLRLPGANRTDILIAIRGEFPDAQISCCRLLTGMARFSMHPFGSVKLRSQKHATG